MTARGLAGTIWCIALVVGTGLICADHAGIRINTTRSIPPGVWRVLPTDAALVRGDYVELCPPDNGSFQLARQRHYLGIGPCPHGYERLFKPVAAVPGSVVTVSVEGIAVDGKVLENSQALKWDHHGLPLQSWNKGQFPVPSGTIWLVSSHTPDSFDSRYFGPLSVTAVQGRLTPLWIMGEPQ